MKTTAAVLSLAALSAGSALKPRQSSLPSVEVKGNGETTTNFLPSIIRLTVNSLLRRQ